MINFNCHQCGRAFTVEDSAAGRTGKCKTCGATVVIPAASASHRPPNSTSTSGASGSPPIRIQFPDLPTPAGTAGAPSVAVNNSSIITAELVSEPTGSRRATPMRTRRLLADAEQVTKSLANSRLIRLQSQSGSPPDLYRIEYFVRGLARGPTGAPVARDHHVVEVQLTSEYPRQSPKCKMLSPVFHPNIEPAAICVGDHWTAGERLIDLIVRIGEMLAYQAYNIKSPLDGEAAMWADHNRQLLPTDSRDLRPEEIR